MIVPEEKIVPVGRPRRIRRERDRGPFIDLSKKQPPEKSDEKGDATEQKASYASDSDVEVTWSDDDNTTNNSKCFYDMAFFVDPKNRREAMKSDRAPQWMEGEKAELDSLEANDTWDVVDRSEVGDETDIMGSAWVYHLKNINEKKEKHKCRIVARGDTQIEGRDYDPNKTYAPVVRYESIRLLLAIAAMFALVLWDIDFSSAYLYATLSRVVYMKPPPGFPWSRVPSYVKNPILRLKKALYGLKQSGHYWWKTLKAYLTSIGCTLFLSESSMYIYRHHSMPNQFMLFVVFVDNLYCASSTMELVSLFMSTLREKFKITDEPLQEILGLEVTKFPNGDVGLTATRYITKLLERFNLTQAYPKMTPLPVGASYVRHLGDRTDKPYAQIVGCLNYLVTTCRPDIAYAAFFLSRFLQNPSEQHWKWSIYATRYLSGTKELGIRFNAKHLTGSPFVAYADAAHNVIPRKSRSVTGYLCLFNGAPVAYKSGKQTKTATSPNYAEYIALSECARTCMWLLSIWREMNIHDKCTKHAFRIWGDNNGANDLAMHGGTTARNRHIRLCYHYIRECVEEDDIVVDKINTKDQLADVFTKALNKESFWKLVNQFMVEIRGQVRNDE